MTKKEKDRIYYLQNGDNIKNRTQIYYQKNKEQINSKRRIKNVSHETHIKKKLSGKNNYEKNKEKILKYQKEYYKNNKEKIKNRVNHYRDNNREKINNSRKNKKTINKIFKLSCNIRSRISTSLKQNGFTKKSKTYQILGCSFQEFKQHLESKFEPWMNWNNYGKYNGELNYGWDIDHVIPLDLGLTEEELIRLNHHTNLQPLCSKVNRDIKRNNPNF